MSIYAIRFGKYVEIRESPTPLTKREMEEIITVTENKIDYLFKPGSSYPVAKHTSTKKNKKIRDAIWDGGTFIVAVDYSRWSPSGVRKGLPKLEDGECVKIEDKTLAKELRDEYSRNLLLGKFNNRFRVLDGQLDMYDDEEDFDGNRN